MSDNGQPDEPKAREILLRATSRAGLQEDDPVYAIIAAQAELLSSVDARDIKAAAAEVQELTEAMKSLKAEMHEVQGSMEVFRNIAHHHLWWLISIIFVAGMLALPLLDLLIGWLQGLARVYGFFGY